MERQLDTLKRAWAEMQATARERNDVALALALGDQRDAIAKLERQPEADTPYKAGVRTPR